MLIIIEHNSAYSHPELKLHIIVLKMQKKYQHALDILRGEWGGRLKVAAEREKMCIELRPHLQLWDEQVSGAKFLLNEECDDWDAYVALLDALAGKHGESIPKEAVTEVRELIEKYVASESASATPKRGPFLALLELHMRTGSGVEGMPCLRSSYPAWRSCCSYMQT